MDVLMKPKMEEEKQKYIAEQKKEATENAISTVKMKIKEKMEAEQAAREAEGEGSKKWNVYSYLYCISTEHYKIDVFLEHLLLFLRY